MNIKIDLLMFTILVFITIELPGELAFLVLSAGILGIICGNKIVKDCRKSMYPDEEDDD